MGILALTADERVTNVKFTKDALSVALRDGRTITVPLAWYPRLFNGQECNTLARISKGEQERNPKMMIFSPDAEQMRAQGISLLAAFTGRNRLRSML